MPSKFVFVAASLVAVLVSPTVAVFDDYPHIQCSACRAVTGVIGERMNETSRLRTSFRKGSRLDENNKVQKVDYEQSELRAVEIMEETCGKLAKYRLRESTEGIRKISKSDKGTRHPRFYGRRDRDQLDNIGGPLKEFCHAMLDEFDEEVVAAIQKERQLAGLRYRLCEQTTKVCGTPRVEAAEKKEKDRYFKQIAKEAIKKQQADKAKEEAEAKEAAIKAAAEEQLEKADDAAQKEEDAHEEAAAASAAEQPPLEEMKQEEEGDGKE